MGGEHDRLTAAEAASVLGWWIEAGVDVAVQDAPRAWLGARISAPVAETASAAASESEPGVVGEVGVEPTRCSRSTGS